jgi:serine/threonine protein phosphatase 1
MPESTLMLGQKSVKAVRELSNRKGTRTYIIGDIHGCFAELLALESKLTSYSLRAGIKSVRFVSVGDLCDRGPDTKRVMEHFVQGKVRGTHDLVLGNHEVFFLLAFAGLRNDLIQQAQIEYSWFHLVLFNLFRSQMTSVSGWKQNGGIRVFESYGASIDDVGTWDAIPSSHLRLIFSAPLVFRSPKAMISHALLSYDDVSLFEAKDQDDDCNQRALDEAIVRCLWERDYPASKMPNGFRHISGHTPMTEVVRQGDIGTIQIDTGAVYGGALTAIELRSLKTTAVKSTFSCRAP